MIDFPYLSSIRRRNHKKIIMLVVDGLGGMRHPDFDKTELEVAALPMLDSLSSRSSTGLTIPVMPGITPGSGPGHMALFGYNPLKYFLGRGVLEGIGIGADISDGDICARGNFCELDDLGNIVDRRAGRIQSNESVKLVNLINEIELTNCDFEVYPVMDYRFELVLRGSGLSSEITDTDPQITGHPPGVCLPAIPAAQRTADLVNEFVHGARKLLKRSGSPGNGVLLRGFSKLPDIPSFAESYALRPAAIAAYPMYRGLAELVGMEVLKCGTSFESELEVLEGAFNGEHDFFFLHYKPADSAGEDGDFDNKVRRLEEFDNYLDRIQALDPDVLVVCGDHSTPSFLAAHSWHPVPFLIKSMYSTSSNTEFNEKTCSEGELGMIQAEMLMLTVLAHADKLNRFGA